MRILTSGKLFVLISMLASTASLAVAVQGCSMEKLPQPARTSAKGEFIFVGEIIGYTEPVADPNNFRGSAIGLKLKVIELINVPGGYQDYIELFMFGRGTDCFPEGSDYKPPIGTRFRLALGAATLVAYRSNGHIRLESSDIFPRIGVDEPLLGYSTNAKSVFDYKKDLSALAKKLAPYEMAGKRKSFDDFLYIEASKDLLRLHAATTEKDRMDILERLLYCPNINYSYLLNSKIGRSTEPSDFPGGSPMWITYEKKLVFGKPKLTAREAQLLSERTSLEKSGAFNYWKTWKNSAD